jgi:hypothetical protein
VNGNGWFIYFLKSIWNNMGSLQAFRRTNAAIISSPQDWPRLPNGIEKMTGFTQSRSFQGRYFALYTARNSISCRRRFQHGDGSDRLLWLPVGKLQATRPTAHGGPAPGRHRSADVIVFCTKSKQNPSCFTLLMHYLIKQVTLHALEDYTEQKRSSGYT